MKRQHILLKILPEQATSLELRKKAFRIEIMSRNEKLNDIIPKFKELEVCLEKIRGSKMKILIAEDDYVSRKFLLKFYLNMETVMLLLMVWKP